jgi:hypothetical protein
MPGDKRVKESGRRLVKLCGTAALFGLLDPEIGLEAPGRVAAAPETGPRYSRRLSDRILIAFHVACDQGELGIAGSLLEICEFAMTRGAPDAGLRRGDDERLIAAFERLWFLRHAQDPAHPAPPGSQEADLPPKRAKEQPRPMTGNPPVKVNRAPVLTLWAAVVAGRLGHPPETALSLASAVAGTAARAKARRLGIADAAEGDGQKRPKPAPRRAINLLGRDVPVAEEGGRVLAADGEGKPAPAAPVAAYVARAFGTRLAEVRAAMEELAARLPPEELNRTAFRLYEAFRPEVPEGAKGWGAKGELDLQRIRDAV